MGETGETGVWNQARALDPGSDSPNTTLAASNARENNVTPRPG